MDNEPQNVVITNIKVPFISLMILMIKWVLASIPALILAVVLGAGAIMIDKQFNIITMLKDLIPL